MIGNTSPGVAPILIVGAGPVGLMLANLLGQAGVTCIVFERREEPVRQSRAIGMTPPSLQRMRRIGLAESIVAHGVRITTARVHGDDGLIGTLDLGRIPSVYPFILSIPQAETERLLRGALTQWPTVTLREGVEVQDVDQHTDGVIAETRCRDGKREVEQGSWLVGCDGWRSTVRRAGGFAFRDRSYGPSFVMADYRDVTPWHDDAHLYFTRDGSLESFPLPGGGRRWVAMLPTGDAAECEGAYLEERIDRLTGLDVSGARVSEPSTFTPHFLLAGRYVCGRLVLAGDAAHVMSPIGGQGMNVGLADAAALADLLVQPADVGRTARGLGAYTRRRRRAFRRSAHRAALGMWVGTRTGHAVSRGRTFILRRALSRDAVAGWLAVHFAMVERRFRLRARDGLASPECKRQFNEQLFGAIAHEYGWMSRVLSLGRDAAWKRRLIAMLPADGRPVCLDLACGHGDLAVLLKQRNHGARITGIDLSAAMLAVARRRAEAAGIAFEQGDLTRTGRPDESLDIVTVGYGLRNAPDLAAALDEIARVLKPGGHLAVLEFSRPDATPLARCELAVLGLWTRLWGVLRWGHADTYGYIAESLAAFPSRGELHAALRARGLSVVTARRGFFGIIETLLAVKEPQW